MRSLPEAQGHFALRIVSLQERADAGVQAYRANVWGSWAAALAGAYPIVRKIVGVGFFDALARDYARAHPSQSGDLNEYGGALAEFVERFLPTRDLPYLPDVARMEWLAHRAYYAANPTPPVLSGEPAVWRLALAPACALLHSPFPLARIWEVHQDDYEGAIEVDFDVPPGWILVHRPRWRAAVCRLGEGDARFLRAAVRGATLQAALEDARADPGFETAAAPARWLEKGVIEL